MGTVKEILEFFVTFGIIDILIYYLFFKKVCGCPKNKWHQLLILAFIGSVFKIIIPPLLYQIIFFIMILVYNKIINKFNFNKNIKSTIFVFIFLLITESMYFMTCEFLNLFNFVEVKNIYSQFIYAIPIKILSIFILWRLKWDFFGLEKTPKKK